MIEKLEKKFGKFAVHGLMKYVIIVYLVGYIAYNINPSFYYQWLMLDVDRLLQGQVWRLITFIIQPIDTSNILLTAIMLYVYFSIGTSLERTMGTFRFNLFYFSGVFFNALAVVIIYVVTYFFMGEGIGINYPIDLYYLNMSMFLVFAAIYPDAHFMLMFMIPFKAKFLMIAYAVLLGVDVVTAFVSSEAQIPFISIKMDAKIAEAYGLSVDSTFQMYAVRDNIWCGIITIIVIVVSLLNFFIFFAEMKKFRLSPEEIRRRREFQKSMQEGMRANRGQAVRPEFRNAEDAKVRSTEKIVPFPNSIIRHKCCICGRTEKDDANLEFRFCTKCEGSYEYCSDHIFTHTHKTSEPEAVEFREAAESDDNTENKD